MFRPCQVCDGPSDKRCRDCDTIYCSAPCQQIDWDIHKHRCSKLAVRTLSVGLVPDTLGLEKTGWKSPIAIQRANETYLRHGLPDAVFEDRAIWSGPRVIPFLHIVVYNRTDMTHQEPKPHLDCVFYTAIIVISEKKAADLVHIARNITYSQQTMECTVGCGCRSMAVATLAVVKEYGYEDAMTWRDAKKKLGELMGRMCKEVKQAGQLAESNKSYKFYATPETDELENSLI